MTYTKISENVYNCAICPTRCDGKTVAQFDFEKDVQFSENIENKIIDYINQKYPNLIASKTIRAGYPDIEIAKRTEPETSIAFIEIKGQARTFMSVAKILKDSNLQPSETIALNLSDLERYFMVNEKENLPFFVVWCLMGRPCIVGADDASRAYFFQDIRLLEKIRQKDSQNTRRFRRESGKGDVVNGVHKGVTVNYHFSLNELVKGFPDLSFL
jgi:hypothetical protein